jgi:hypothetical protein
MSEKDEQNMSQDSNTTPRRVGPSKASLSSCFSSVELAFPELAIRWATIHSELMR